MVGLVLLTDMLKFFSLSIVLQFIDRHCCYNLKNMLSDQKLSNQELIKFCLIKWKLSVFHGLWRLNLYLLHNFVIIFVQCNTEILLHAVTLFNG